MESKQLFQLFDATCWRIGKFNIYFTGFLKKISEVKK